MGDLPHEIYSYIFNFINEPRDLLQISLTCRLFYKFEEVNLRIQKGFKDGSIHYDPDLREKAKKKYGEFKITNTSKFVDIKRAVEKKIINARELHDWYVRQDIWERNNLNTNEKLSKILFSACKDENPKENKNFGINYACRMGMIDWVKYFLDDERVNPSFCNNESLKQACYAGYSEIVKLLLADKRVDPSVDNNEPGRLACLKGSLDILDLLMMDSRVKKTFLVGEGIRLAALNGHYKVIHYLVTHTSWSN